MNRRDFLSKLGIGLGVASVVPVVRLGNKKPVNMIECPNGNICYTCGISGSCSREKGWIEFCSGNQRIKKWHEALEQEKQYLFEEAFN